MSINISYVSAIKSTTFSKEIFQKEYTDFKKIKVVELNKQLHIPSEHTHQSIHTVAHMVNRAMAIQVHRDLYLRVSENITERLDWHLYEILSQERIDYLENAGIEINADDDYYTREQNRVYNAKEPSSIRNKLKNLLNIDVKLYKHKSDEENYNTLKLLYLIANTNRYDDDNPLQEISIIDLISTPSLEFSDHNYALYSVCSKSSKRLYSVNSLMLFKYGVQGF